MPTKLTLIKPNRVVKTFRVNSRTQVNSDTGEPIHYLVRLFENGKYDCECPAYRKCWHIQLKEKQQKENANTI